MQIGNIAMKTQAAVGDVHIPLNLDDIYTRNESLKYETCHALCTCVDTSAVTSSSQYSLHKH